MGREVRRVLIADDDPSIRRMLSRALREWGHQVSVVADGTAAFAELASDEPPALALLDLEMPGMTGQDVCRRVRALGRANSGYLMLLSAYASVDIVVDAFHDGFDDVVEKPFDLRELRARIDSALRASRSSAALPRARTLYPVGMRAPLEGRIVADKFRVEHLVGEGGMGTVWKGRDLGDDSPVAVKFVRPKLVTDDVAVARFRVEALVGTRLRSRHVTRVLDYGLTCDKLPFLVMEYLEGESLLQHVSREGPLSTRAAGVLVSQIASALSEARALGIEHRDVKPENIFLARDGGTRDDVFPYTAKLIDFGIAKIRPRTTALGAGEDSLVGASIPPSPLTSHGCLVGTPHYMSPEQLLGHIDGDLWADLWGLAASAFFAVTGDAPFEGATLGQIVMRVCSDPLPRTSANGRIAKPAFDAWFEIACARDAGRRYQSAGALAEALIAVGAGEAEPAFAKSGTFSIVERRHDEALARAR